MNDHHTHVDHRMAAAQATNQSSRGYDFRPMPVRAAFEILRPRSLVILAVLAGVVSLWWL
jgi:hypothetical protein